MKKHKCTVCQYIYDPKVGDPENQVEPGTPFEELPEGWLCPICGESKWAFEEIED